MMQDFLGDDYVLKNMEMKHQKLQIANGGAQGSQVNFIYFMCIHNLAKAINITILLIS